MFLYFHIKLKQYPLQKDGNAAEVKLVTPQCIYCVTHSDERWEVFKYSVWIRVVLSLRNDNFDEQFHIRS